MMDIPQSDTGMSDAPVTRGWPHWLTRRRACHDHRRAATKNVFAAIGVWCGNAIWDALSDGPKR
jgi:hypothetical protein